MVYLKWTIETEHKSNERRSNDINHKTFFINVIIYITYTRVRYKYTEHFYKYLKNRFT